MRWGGNRELRNLWFAHRRKTEEIKSWGRQWRAQPENTSAKQRMYFVRKSRDLEKGTEWLKFAIFKFVTVIWLFFSFSSLYLPWHLLFHLSHFYTLFALSVFFSSYSFSFISFQTFSVFVFIADYWCKSLWYCLSPFKFKLPFLKALRPFVLFRPPSTSSSSFSCSFLSIVRLPPHCFWGSMRS